MENLNELLYLTARFFSYLLKIHRNTGVDLAFYAPIIFLLDINQANLSVTLARLSQKAAHRHYSVF